MLVGVGIVLGSSEQGDLPPVRGVLGWAVHCKNLGLLHTETTFLPLPSVGDIHFVPARPEVARQSNALADSDYRPASVVVQCQPDLTFA